MKPSTNNDFFEILFDNGGGAVFQIKDGSYVHYYNDMSQLATDVKAFQKTGTTADWDGNEPEAFISDEAYDKSPGSYYVIDGNDIKDMPISQGWLNVSQFIESYNN